MKYQNIKTKVIVDVSSKITGENWQPVDKVAESVKKPKPQAIVKKEPETDDSSKGITKEQIMKELDAFGIKYNVNDKKDVLYELMMKQGNK